LLILASRSPRRQSLLRSAGIDFRVVAPPMADATSRRVRGSYAAWVRRAALKKALAVAAHERGVVLGADTIVVCEGEVLGKPSGPSDARRMLRKLSGKWHRVYTGVALVCGRQRLLDYELTEVAFRRLSKHEIDWYVETGEPMDKAGAYAIQAQGAGLVQAVRGCYTNVIGLPLPTVLKMLAQFRPEDRAR
jgi:septum formation protein